LTQEASEVVNFDQPLTGRAMCSGAIVANDEIADSCARAASNAPRPRILVESE
jgi:hypothetical protein